MGMPGPQTFNSSRMLKWVLIIGGGAVACGALAMCAVMLLPLIISAVVVGPDIPEIVPMIATGMATGGLSEQDVYIEAVQIAKDDPRVQNALGTPIEDEPDTSTGEVTTRGSSGNADFLVTLTGPKNSGRLQASARRENGVWVYYTLLITVDGEDIVLEK